MILLQKRFTLFQTQFVNIGGNSLVELIFEMHEQRRTAIMKNTAQIGNSNAFPIVFRRYTRAPRPGFVERSDRYIGRLQCTLQGKTKSPPQNAECREWGTLTRRAGKLIGIGGIEADKFFAVAQHLTYLKITDVLSVNDHRLKGFRQMIVTFINICVIASRGYRIRFLSLSLHRR